MKVSIKDFAVTMGLGTKGVEFDVYDPSGNRHLGDLRVGKATITWSPGKTSKHVIQKSWEELIAWFEQP